MADKVKRNTLQKQTVLDVVKSLRTHPTAEEVYRLALERMPSISLATVYRILREAAAEGKIRDVIGGVSDRFDFNTSEHAHFICDKCGRVYDVEADLSRLDVRLPGEGRRVNLTFGGVCYQCKNALSGK